MWVIFAQLFPTHILSLKSVLGFCHGIAKGGDCKVEFNQPSYWFYSMPNLLVLVWSRRWLMAASRQMQHTCQACQKVNNHASWSITRQNKTTGHTVISQLDLATQTSREAKLRATPVLKNLTFHILLSPQYKYPLYSQMKESFQREFWERNPRLK